jgi:hypothetical protein
MPDENERLNELLMPDGYMSALGQSKAQQNSMPVPLPFNAVTSSMNLCQWQVGADDLFRPASRTVQSLPAGAYAVMADDLGPYLRGKTILTDDIIDLPETANGRVLESIQKFWRSRERYRHHGLIFKRGVLLWGPPGSGKTVTVNLLLRDIVARDGIVLFCSRIPTRQLVPGVWAKHDVVRTRPDFGCVEWEKRNRKVLEGEYE